ncbi:hypothetical protein MMC07_003258 [Pseudocyphellaria aurata]|nr:hypothetical protein [Pseudocyphellaria aurata]
MALHSVSKKGNTALITGAASGIGLANICQGRGMKLALVNVNAEQLIKTKDLFGSQTDLESYPTNFIGTDHFGVINDTATFLPSIRTQPASSTIVITGSKQRITNPPGIPVYNAFKAATKSFAEHLSYDLHSSATSALPLPLSICSSPGWTHTGPTDVGTIQKKPDGI